MSCSVLYLLVNIVFLYLFQMLFLYTTAFCLIPACKKETQKVTVAEMFPFSCLNPFATKWKVLEKLTWKWSNEKQNASQLSHVLCDLEQNTSKLVFWTCRVNFSTRWPWRNPTEMDLWRGSLYFISKSQDSIHRFHQQIQPQKQRKEVQKAHVISSEGKDAFD